MKHQIPHCHTIWLLNLKSDERAVSLLSAYLFFFNLKVIFYNKGRFKTGQFMCKQEGKRFRRIRFLFPASCLKIDVIERFDCLIKCTRYEPVKEVGPLRGVDRANYIIFSNIPTFILTIPTYPSHYELIGALLSGISNVIFHRDIQL